MTNLAQAHDYPGKLIVVEGIDGSGKSTQLALLQKWLESKGISCFFTEWNSSPLVKRATKAGKKKMTLTPTTFSLLHATDFADRHTYEILPPLRAGMFVLADRYAFTAFARDRARGVHPEWIRSVYGFGTKPDVALYFRVPLEMSLDRILSARAKLKYYEAGMDMNLSQNIVQSFRMFQSRVLVEYDKMIGEFGLEVVDATRSIQEQQRHVRELVSHKLRLPWSL